MERIIQQHTALAREKLLEKSKQKNQATEAEKTFQGLLFVGNKHETVPLRLLTDSYLSPRAKVAWQMIKLNAYQFQGTAFPSYDELALWLSDRAFQGKSVSRKVVSQTLLLLRLTRWLTLCETVRNERGQVLGNVYVMNDEPLLLADSLQLNGDYLKLLEKSAKHADPLVCAVANAIIDEMLKPENQLHHFVSHIPVIQARIAQQHNQFVIRSQAVELDEKAANIVQQATEIFTSSNMELSEESMNLQSSNMELSEKSVNLQSSNMELSEKSVNLQSSNMELSTEKSSNPLISLAVPNRNSDTVQYSTKYSKYSTVASDQVSVESALLKFELSKMELQQLSQLLQTLSEETRQAVLLEAEKRIASGSVKKPAGYLFSLIRKAQTGVFNPYFKQKSVEQVQAKPKESREKQGSMRVLPSKVTRSSANNQRSLEIIQQLAKSMVC
ncbi:STY4528 family pathogenicity island replication protein [Mannheimia haemolytica]|uniref:STY4528 family pathogenicity island replication protein n=1 Tax=Mannheimia haemolytica TaxID=75985 RepID=UPI00201C5C93|nr:STY4528 family pathogenicity island replication protein [Mannheimia haemolytica]UQX80514.1 STY4528 family pathogenicity island replication protein [Mannheimia haemolytica]